MASGFALQQPGHKSKQSHNTQIANPAPLVPSCTFHHQGSDQRRPRRVEAVAHILEQPLIIRIRAT